MHDNPRLIAMAAWGRALVASRRDDVVATLRWVTAAENTALTGADDVLGVPFLCDMATVLGALGELDLASRYLERAADRRSVFPDQVASTAFVLDARRGELGDVAVGLALHPTSGVVAGRARRRLRLGPSRRPRAGPPPAGRVQPRAGGAGVQQRRGAR